MRLAANGQYGRGIYFAGEASYSATSYFHTNKSGNHVLILARVLVGNYSEGPVGSHITCPPLLPGSLSERYDSIKASGSDIFIVYNNNKAYPSYTIEYNNHSFNNRFGGGGLFGPPVGMVPVNSAAGIFRGIAPQFKGSKNKQIPQNQFDMLSSEEDNDDEDDEL